MEEDVRQVAVHLGYERIALVGHDRDARVATRFAKDHRGMVDRLAVLDNIPTRVVFNATDAKLATLYWFFYFQQVPHLPAALIQGPEVILLRHFYTTWSYTPAAIAKTAV